MDEGMFDVILTHLRAKWSVRKKKKPCMQKQRSLLLLCEIRDLKACLLLSRRNIRQLLAKISNGSVSSYN